MMRNVDAIDAYPGPHERREKVYLDRDGEEIEVEVVCHSDGQCDVEIATAMDGSDVELTDNEIETASIRAWRGGGW